MPLEGHYERQTTPLYKLSSREIKVAFSILIVTVVETCAHAAEFTGARAETIVANCEKQGVKF
jgi:hypothetical protein